MNEFLEAIETHPLASKMILVLLIVLIFSVAVVLISKSWKND